MSAPVDVLAVLDMSLLYVQEAHEIHPGDFKPGVGKRNTSDVVKARAAVAELIEAATAARDHVRPTCTELFERLDAALARCKGEQP